jgi:protein-S-isoprenylcysteine O-methyltransferase Ste14
MRTEYLLLALLWAIYCAVHSALISTGAIKHFKHLLGSRFCFYRLMFNSFSLITLIALIIFSHAPKFQGPMLFAWSGNWRWIRYSLILAAVGLILSGARHYSMSQFVGLQQIRSNQYAGTLSESGEFDSTGILGIVRHPWYTAVFILLWASKLNSGTIIINVVLSAYLVIGTVLEERKLLLEFGNTYREYQEKVSMFIPLKWLTGRRSN